MTTSTSSVHKSRWGLHPCDYTLFTKLKYLHKCYWYAIHDNARLDRWDRKEPQNRVIRRREARDLPRVVIGPMPEPLVCPHFYHGIGKSGNLADMANEYQNARMPRASEEDVRALRFSEDYINRLYFICKEWMGKNYPSRP